MYLTLFTLEMENAEKQRLDEDARREANWKRWGPYLADRQWGTVREDYSADNSAWTYFPHDDARSRAYRWGEDGLLGMTDRQCRLCFALALWNGRDPILKERFFGLTGPEGNHGEDVKEAYFYLDATPTYSYLKALYKYPHDEYPYARLVEESRRRGRSDPELELLDTGLFQDHRYFDVLVEYAKASTDDIFIRITIGNRGPKTVLHLLPTLWFRNTWAWGRVGEGYWAKPKLCRIGQGLILADHTALGRFLLEAEHIGGPSPSLLFTENETNREQLFGTRNETPFVKDAFHSYVVHGVQEAVNPQETGTKAALYYRLSIPAGEQVSVHLRLCAESAAPHASLERDTDRVFAERIREADEFYEDTIASQLSEEERRIARQAYGGLLWNTQFYHFVVKDWLEGDPIQPPSPPERWNGRNHDWIHLYNRDVISVPDKWEYPWYAVWDLAFHMIPFAHVDPQFAKSQLILFLREWYMHPNGQIPAYEFDFSDVNPPVHAWAAWRVYKMTGPKGQRDRRFLATVFQKLLLNFTWWVNRKDIHGQHLFAGGFLGLDNIGLFDRSRPLPGGGHLEQADGTAWMAFYCATMLSMALELAKEDPAYEHLAYKFFRHFISIADAMNTLGGQGLWDETDGFYYDHLDCDGTHLPLRIRSIVGIIPLFAVEVLEEHVIEELPDFVKRMRWFLTNRSDLALRISYMICDERATPGSGAGERRLLAIPTQERLMRVLRYVLDENEFLSPYGIRSMSKVYEAHPYIFHIDGRELSVKYVPGESDSGLFGGNSNWRGPIWFPVNFLLIEALERYHHFYGDQIRVECPVGSGQMLTLQEVARELTARLVQLFLPDHRGHRPCHGDTRQFAADPYWRDLVLFHEYFHGDTGHGLGASHQTGWTALITRCLDILAEAR